MKRVLVLFLALALILSLCGSAVSAAPKKPVTPPELSKAVFVHYEHPGKGPPPGKGKPDKEEEPKEYTNSELLGPSWDLSDGSVPYYFNPGGPWGLPKGITFDEALNAITLGYEAWDEATTAELFYYAGETTATPSFDEPDEVNIVCWWGIAPPRTIAMTIVWYYDTTGDGMSPDDELVDCDILFNALQKWSVTGTKKAFDVQNIATHEAGHVTGLDDLYDEVDSEMTMYGYSKKGETKKYTLEEGDWEGCRALYGGVEFPYQSPRD